MFEIVLLGLFSMLLPSVAWLWAEIFFEEDAPWFIKLVVTGMVLIVIGCFLNGSEIVIEELTTPVEEKACD